MAGLTGSSADKVLRFLPFFLIAALIIFPRDSRAEDVLLTVNIKKPLALTSDKFLSYTLDPTVVLTSDALTRNSERSMNMAKALAPAYVRIGGPRSNSYTFERTYRSQDEEDPGFTFTEANWMNVHHWAENAGLDVLACIAPQHSESRGRDTGWDSRNALDLISFSDHAGLNTSWQLGYECQTRCDVAGSDIGKDVIRLRSMLDAFPRYSQSIIAGPDVVTYRTKHQQQYLQDFLSVAGTALSAITWHPDFASITLDPEGVSMHHDNLALDRDSMYKVMGRLISKKPLWLAESKPEECKRQFLGALVWTRRLGNTAKLGVQVLMRQPDGSNLFQATPDYWVSVLHKTLVGREVLDTKIVAGNRTHVHFYCQCTKPSSKYEKGSLTIFGINLTPAKVVANFKGIKVKTLHKYILLPGFDAENRMFSETVLLNNEPLNLLNESVLPEIKPAISNNSKGVTLKLPSGGIGFWVIPGLKIKSCGGLDEDNSDKMSLKKLTKRLDVAEFDEESVNEENVEEDEDEERISSEERRHSTKPSKDKRRRKHRFSEEDDAERRSRKFEAKMDLEKLEKLLRRRDNHDERKQPRVRTAYFGFEEKSQEKIIEEEDDETGAEIRSKLEEYKSRLKDYESRKKNEAKSRDRSKITDSLDGERIDGEKVTEALALILKMENAMKRSDEINDQSPVYTLNPSVSYNVTSDLAKPGESTNPEDMFLNELLKSAKIKRTSVPSKIEVQLRAIYQMLAEERSRRQRNTTEAPVVEVVRDVEEPLRKIDESLSRNRRDTEKKFEDDPLGLRKEGLFRRRTKNEDSRDRRNERKTRRKDKDDRKDGQSVIFDPKTAVDSNENNFYGFHRREPLKGFPEGDVLFTTGTSSEEGDKDYDYVRDDDDAQDRERPRKKPKTSERVTNQSDTDDTTWVEDENSQLNHVPHEFFEDIKTAVPRVKENLKEYGELWEAEALGESQDDHQDHFNDGDEKATVEKIVQEHRFDAHEDKRAKETTVRKLIGYYENPRSHHEEVTDYFGPEKNDKSRAAMRNAPRNTPSEIQNKKPSLESTAIGKRVEDSALNDYGGFANFDSMHFGRSPTSSPEDEPPYDLKYPVVRPAVRTKRFADDLEMILDQEMIFQDDNNLKDCECRVIRGTRGSRRRDDREHAERRHRPGRPERRRNEERAARAERRKQRNRDGLSKLGARSRFDEDYMHATRSKRQARSSGEDAKELSVVEPHISVEYPNDESDSTVKEIESGEISGESNVHIENTNVDASRETPNDFNGADEVQGNGVEKVVDEVEKTKDLAVEEENANLTVENAAQDSDRGNIPKKHGETKAIITKGTQSTDSERRKKSIHPASEDVEASSVESPAEPEEPTDKSPKDSKADQSFLGTESKNNEKSSSTAYAAPDLDASSTAFEVDESLQSVQIPSSENNQSIVDTRSNGGEANITTFLPVTISNPGNVVEEEIEPTEQENGEISMTVATDNILEDQKTSIIMTGDNDKGTVSDGPMKLDDGEDTTDISTTEGGTTLSIHKGIPKSLKSAKDSPRIARKAQKTKQTPKSVDPSKAREARIAARSDALMALRKENEARKSKKSLEATSKFLLSEHNKFQSMQKKRAEQLEKLREKLRRKRAKMVQEYRTEVLDDFDDASSGEERNLKRREIIDMINDDDELRDIVDREKLEYLMHNEPINYETVGNEYRVDKAAQRKKYVPKMVEIVNPLSEVRERKVKTPNQPIRYSNDPRILAYASSDELTNSEAIRKALQGRIDLTDHKVKRRSGKIYYSVVESLENPRIYQYPRSTEHESGEEESNELAETVVLEQALRNKHNEKENVQKCNEGVSYAKENRHWNDYKRPHKVSGPHEESDKSPTNSIHPPRLTRNTSNLKNKYMCLNKILDANSNVNQNELFDLIKAKKHYVTLPMQDDKTDNDEFIAKKKYPKDSSYELNSKYESPKYARLAPEKVEVEGGTSVNSRKYLEDHRLKSDDSEESLQEIGSINLRKSEESNDKVELCRNDSRKEDDEQKEADTEIIDDLDLDDVLNLSKYELLMLIPVKNYKKSRSRRYIANDIFRDQENSALNEISVELPLKKNAIGSLHKDLLIKEMSGRRTENNGDLSQSVKSIESNQINEANNSISESSKVLIVQNSNDTETSVAEKRPILDRHSVDETVRSVPEMVNDKESHDINVLPELLEEQIPRLATTVPSGLIKVRHISESFKKFVDEFEDRFNQKQLEFEKENQESIEPATITEKIPMNCNIFSTATTNLKKFFDFVSSIIRIFRFV